MKNRCLIRKRKNQRLWDTRQTQESPPLSHLYLSPMKLDGFNSKTCDWSQTEDSIWYTPCLEQQGVLESLPTSSLVISSWKLCVRRTMWRVPTRCSTKFPRWVWCQIWWRTRLFFFKVVALLVLVFFKVVVCTYLLGFKRL